MSANAYVLLTVEPAKTGEVVDRLRSISGATVQEVLGPYDVIVELTSDTPVDITSTVRSQIRDIPGVNSIVTCTFVDGIFGDSAGGEWGLLSLHLAVNWYGSIGAFVALVVAAYWVEDEEIGGWQLAVTVILKRSPKVGVTGELLSILHDLRQLATSQRGCISGQTLLPTFNGCSTLVVPRWMLLQLWQQYENCPEPPALVDSLEPLLNEPASSEVYLESKRVDSVIEKGSSDREISAGEDSPSQQPAIDWKQPLLVRGMDKRGLWITVNRLNDVVWQDRPMPT